MNTFYLFLIIAIGLPVLAYRMMGPKKIHQFFSYMHIAEGVLFTCYNVWTSYFPITTLPNTGGLIYGVQIDMLGVVLLSIYWMVLNGDDMTDICLIALNLQSILWSEIMHHKSHKHNTLFNLVGFCTLVLLTPFWWHYASNPGHPIDSFTDLWLPFTGCMQHVHLFYQIFIGATFIVPVIADKPWPVWQKIIITAVSVANTGWAYYIVLYLSQSTDEPV